VEPEETPVFKQCLGKHISTAANIHAAIEELLDTVFPIRSVSYQYVCGKNMIMNPSGLGTKNDCAGENKQKFNWPTGRLLTSSGKSRQPSD
jgi:hypothetical protein